MISEKAATVIDWDRIHTPSEPPTHIIRIRWVVLPCFMDQVFGAFATAIGGFYSQNEVYLTSGSDEDAKVAFVAFMETLKASRAVFVRNAVLHHVKRAEGMLLEVGDRICSYSDLDGVAK